MAFPVQTLTQLRPILVGFRKSAGLTQAQLAARLGITQQSYAQLEANPSAVSIERLFKVLNALGVRMMLSPDERDAPAEAADSASGAEPPARRKPVASKRGATAAQASTGAAADAARKRPAATTRARPRVSKREDW
ncbi:MULTISPECIES: helix-turn-helix domain-containing protein [Burkholderia]|uniref:Helix-turn-helix transcriptional regulator n=1 Tax=Burkholderia sola TaxID=2843302 RepID=A0ABV2C628_9BURK|nr:MULTISPECIES: helix-turn-helix transcriptional regulator [Burkholderia]KWU24172.1 XRE family transcriptional regulator [Burkholderia cenocepacia]MBP0606639.1 helix-turn-helix transcriptional regulator [Burkholderia sp. CpTa8-5]MBP0711957.1 helix-turn-helix transcriptional regulator [Burkholderia sp. AcTa6-5]OXI71214.1 transcriptional regulator [Burkholderia sp. AU31280]QRR15477.1 helix-turn-helix domain-containing protein [Burkholderia sp. MS389]